jgi:hypothetical protein
MFLALTRTVQRVICTVKSHHVAKYFFRYRDAVQGCDQKVSRKITITNLTAHAWSIKCRREKKIIAQFGWKSRDERFEPN